MGLGDIDPVKIVIDILKAGWDETVIGARVEGELTEPTIDKKAKWPSGAANVASGDFVLGYPISRSHRFADSNANWQGATVEVALDVRTDDEGDMNKILSEIERICHVAPVDPSPEFDLLDYGGVDYAQYYGGLYRNVLSVRLIAHCRSITGG